MSPCDELLRAIPRDLMSALCRRGSLVARRSTLGER
jgi:hypothetical protein